VEERRGDRRGREGKGGEGSVVESKKSVKYTLDHMLQCKEHSLPCMCRISLFTKTRHVHTDSTKYNTVITHNAQHQCNYLQQQCPL